MADAPASLGDFFAKKKKKAAKGTNMNNEASTAKVEDTGGKKKKDKADDEWEEEQVVETTMNVSVAGRLRTAEEEAKDEGEDQKAAWGGGGKSKTADRRDLTDKRFPTLQKSVVGPSSNINIDDGSQGTINIKTTKNVFASLQDEDDDDAGPKRPKHIAPAMVKKQKGEFESVAIKREVDKYSKKDEKGRKKKNKDDEDDSEEEEEDEDEEDEEAKDAARAAKKTEKKKVKKVEEAPEKEEVEKDEDCKIAPDEKASRAKYIGRAKLETKPLSKAELQSEKKAPQNISKKKKKFMDADEEEQGNKRVLATADWD